MAENLMDIKQASEYLQMNKMTVYKLARAGRIPAFRVANEWRFRKDLIDAWLMSQLEGKPELEKFKLEEKLEKGKTVLIVDDEKAIQDFFARALTEYRVLTASNGIEAIDIVKKDKPDLILLDIKMPGIDGIETLRQIKEIDKGIPVIMLSAYATVETSLKAARLGAYDSIAKPFDLGDMKSVIKSALLSEAKEERPSLKEISKKRAAKKIGKREK